MGNLILGGVFSVACVAVLRVLMLRKCEICRRPVHRSASKFHNGICPICHYLKMAFGQTDGLELPCVLCGQPAWKEDTFLVFEGKATCGRCLKPAVDFATGRRNQYLYSERKPVETFLLPAFAVFCLSSVWVPVLFLLGVVGGALQGDVTQALRVSAGLSLFVISVAAVFAAAVYAGLRLVDRTHLVVTDEMLYEISVFGEKYPLTNASWEEIQQRKLLWGFCKYLPWGCKNCIVLRFKRTPEEHAGRDQASEREFRVGFTDSSKTLWRRMLADSECITMPSA